MFKNGKNIILFIAVYILIFWIGFKAGAIYNHMHSKKIEKPAIGDYFYAVETRDRGTYSEITFEEMDAQNVIIKFLFNENLKPLLKLRNIKIYTQKGERVY